MKHLRWAAGFAAAALLGAAPAGDVFEVAVPPEEGEAYAAATYRIWIPPDVPKLRGIVVRQHGCGEGARRYGLTYPDDLQWRALARKHGCALLGSKMVSAEGDCQTWCVPFNGTEAAFLRALDRLAEGSGRPELRQVPWALWGHSGGALWVSNMTFAHPDRVVAAFPKSGALSPDGRKYRLKPPRAVDSEPRALQVPILFCTGAKEADPQSRFNALVRGVRKMMAYGRPRGALWASAAEPGCGHENRNTRALAIPFFDATLSLRLPPPPEGDAVVTLPPHDGAGGWLGDPETRGIAPAADFEGDAAKAVWLPNEAVAKAWREFVETGTVADATPPPAPADVRAERTDAGTVVTWRAEADVESGLAAFRIYRDGGRIGELRGTAVKHWNEDANVHAWNYHDQPHPAAPPPPMRFVDPDGGPGAAYRVTAVNRAGLESRPE